MSLTSYRAAPPRGKDGQDRNRRLRGKSGFGLNRLTRQLELKFVPMPFPYSTNRSKISTQFWPPKANELDITRRTSAVRAWLGT